MREVKPWDDEWMADNDFTRAYKAARAERAAAVRASVERGDPLAHMKPSEMAVIHAHTNLMLRHICAGLPDGLSDLPLVAALAFPPEPDPPQPVTADPEPFDTEPNRDYLDDVSPHSEDCYSGSSVSSTPESRGQGSQAGWSEETRLAWLARVQRIDPRERRP